MFILLLYSRTTEKFTLPTKFIVDGDFTSIAPDSSFLFSIPLLTILKLWVTKMSRLQASRASMYEFFVFRGVIFQGWQPIVFGFDGFSISRWMTVIS